MGVIFPPECSRNRCLARWTVWIPHLAAEAEQVERTRSKTWLRARSEVFVPYKLDEAKKRYVLGEADLGLERPLGIERMREQYRLGREFCRRRVE